MFKTNNKEILANTLRILSAKMINKANSGHPGMPLGFADAITAILYEINYDPTSPKWINRDRLIFSCGHGSALWYSVLYGFEALSKKDLEEFRQLGSKTPGHLEKSENTELTTGPLGMGFSWAIGTALAERILNAKEPSIDHHTYIICSDGDLMEGISYEAASIAGLYKLNKIIALFDDNSITIDGTTEISRNEDMKKRFESQNWNYTKVDGHNIKAIQKAIQKAKKSDKPTLIACKTKIGKYSINENTPKAHGTPLTQENIEKLSKKIEWNEEIFLEEMNKIKEKNIKNRKAWEEKFEEKNSKIQFTKEINLPKTEELKEKLSKSEATRTHSENILEELIKANENIIICSADLSKSCGTAPKSGKSITAKDYNGNLLSCGIRENAMVAIAGGITEHSILKGIASTFLTFYDYARPAVRLAALMETPLIMIATHDSIAVGEDGPTHQPIEHLDSFHCMPNLTVARPGDGFETYWCYEEILKNKKPTLLVLTRQALNNIHKTFINKKDLIFFEENEINGTIIASGSELDFAVKAGKNLNKKVISQPIIDKTLLKNEKYSIHIIEASSGTYMSSIFSKASTFSINQFGESGTQKDVLKHFGFTQENIENWIKSTNSLKNKN